MSRASRLKGRRGRPCATYQLPATRSDFLRAWWLKFLSRLNTWTIRQGYVTSFIQPLPMEI